MKDKLINAVFGTLLAVVAFALVGYLLFLGKSHPNLVGGIVTGAVFILAAYAFTIGISVIRNR